MPLLFSKYAVSFVLLMGPENCTAIITPPTSNATSATESAIRATLAAVMASPAWVGVPHRGRVDTPATEWARSVRRRAAAGPAGGRRAAGHAGGFGLGYSPEGRARARPRGPNPGHPRFPGRHAVR